MGVKLLRFSIFRGSTKKHALFRALIIALVLFIVPLMEITSETELEAKNHVVNLSNLGQLLFDKLVEQFWVKYKSEKSPEVVISGVTSELMRLKLLRYDSKSLFIGQGTELAVSVFKEKGFLDIQKVSGHSLFAFMRRKNVYKLEFPKSSFDFVYYGDTDQVVASPSSCCS